MHFSKSFGNFERQLPLKKGIGKFQRHLPLKLNQSPSKLGSLPVEVIGFSSKGQNAYRPLVSEACLGRFRVIFFNSDELFLITLIFGIKRGVFLGLGPVLARPGKN